MTTDAELIALVAEARAWRGQTYAANTADLITRLASALEAARADEREACARLAEKWRDQNKAAMSDAIDESMRFELRGAMTECNALAAACKQKETHNMPPVVVVVLVFAIVSGAIFWSRSQQDVQGVVYTEPSPPIDIQADRVRPGITPLP